MTERTFKRLLLRWADVWGFDIDDSKGIIELNKEDRSYSIRYGPASEIDRLQKHTAPNVEMLLEMPVIDGATVRDSLPEIADLYVLRTDYWYDNHPASPAK
jgi:hypothetical protein